jgi:hypothetical protein
MKAEQIRQEEICALAEYAAGRLWQTKVSQEQFIAWLDAEYAVIQDRWEDIKAFKAA